MSFLFACSNESSISHISSRRMDHKKEKTRDPDKAGDSGSSSSSVRRVVHGESIRLEAQAPPLPVVWAKELQKKFSRYMRQGIGATTDVLPQLCLSIPYMDSEGSDIPTLGRAIFYCRNSKCTIYMFLSGILPFVYISNNAFKNDMGDRFSARAPTHIRQYTAYVREILACVSELMWPDSNRADFMRNACFVEVEDVCGSQYLVISKPANACHVFGYGKLANSFADLSGGNVTGGSNQALYEIAARLLCMIMFIDIPQYIDLEILADAMTNTNSGDQRNSFLRRAADICKKKKHTKSLFDAATSHYLTMCYDAAKNRYCMVEEDDADPDDI